MRFRSQRVRKTVVALGAVSLAAVFVTSGCGNNDGDGDGDAGDGDSMGGASSGGGTGDGDGAGIGFERQTVVDALQGVLELLDDDEEEPDEGNALSNPAPTKPVEMCTPGTQGCSCTENFTCNEGLNCEGGLCGQVARWGIWNEGAGWPQSQEMVWGGDAGMGGAAPLNQRWADIETSEEVVSQ